jgi:hypothetical protein
VSTTSSPVTINVNNASPSTTVLIPSSGSTLDSAKQDVFDASASPGVNQVSFYITGDCGGATLTAPPRSSAGSPLCPPLRRGGTPVDFNSTYRAMHLIRAELAGRVQMCPSLTSYMSLGLYRRLLRRTGPVEKWAGDRARDRVSDEPYDQRYGPALRRGIGVMTAWLEAAPGVPPDELPQSRDPALMKRLNRPLRPIASLTRVAYPGWLVAGAVTTEPLRNTAATNPRSMMLTARLRGE